jgi:hypothetical protein
VDLKIFMPLCSLLSPSVGGMNLSLENTPGVASPVNTMATRARAVKDNVLKDYHILLRVVSHLVASAHLGMCFQLQNSREAAAAARILQLSGNMFSCRLPTEYLTKLWQMFHLTTSA